MGTTKDRLAVLRWIVVLAGLLATISPHAADAADEGTPAPEWCGLDATPMPVGDERVEIVVRVTPRDATAPLAKSVNEAWEVISGRLACYAPEATVVVCRPDRIVVSVSSERDIADVTALITRPKLLEIIDPRGRTLSVGTVVTTSLGGPEDVLAPSVYAGEEVDDAGYETIVSGADVVDADAVHDQLDNPAVQFSLTEEAADRFYDFTSANIGQPMAIVLDKRVISSPTIQGPVSDQVVISGLFTEEEVADLVASLSPATMPAPFEVVSVDGTPVTQDGTPVAVGT